MTNLLPPLPSKNCIIQISDDSTLGFIGQWLCALTFPNSGLSAFQEIWAPAPVSTHQNKVVYFHRNHSPWPFLDLPFIGTFEGEMLAELVKNAIMPDRLDSESDFTSVGSFSDTFAFRSIPPHVPLESINFFSLIPEEFKRDRYNSIYMVINDDLCTIAILSKIAKRLREYDNFHHLIAITRKNLGKFKGNSEFPNYFRVERKKNRNHILGVNAITVQVIAQKPSPLQTMFLLNQGPYNPQYPNQPSFFYYNPYLEKIDPSTIRFPIWQLEKTKHTDAEKYVRAYHSEGRTAIEICQLLKLRHCIFINLPTLRQLMRKWKITTYKKHSYKTKSKK